MKYYKIYLLVFVLVFIGCKDVINNYEETSKLKVSSPIDDITFDEGLTSFRIDLSGIFEVEGNANAEIIKSIYSNQNNSLVQLNITADSLFLSIYIGQTGNSDITIRGEYEGEVEYTTFTLTVNSISDNEALNLAINNFQGSNYESAETYFQVLISKNNTQLVSDAYMGLGFSQMRLEKYNKSYNSFQNSLSYDNTNIFTKSGICLLEYASRKNYWEAIRYGQEVLTLNSNYIFKYDSTLNHYDIVLNIALSQYALQLFEDCLISIQIIEPNYALNINDPDFQTNLFVKLEELINVYSP